MMLGRRVFFIMQGSQVSRIERPRDPPAVCIRFMDGRGLQLPLSFFDVFASLIMNRNVMKR